MQAGDPEVIETIRAGIVTVSDSGARGERKDLSGPAIRDILKKRGIHVLEYRLVSDDRERLQEVITDLCDRGNLDIVFTTGGTGLGPRDVTPEATLAVIEREVPGIPEAMRAESMKKTPNAMLSRARAGIRGGTLVVNMPGSPRACAECLAVLMPALPHAVEVIRGKSRDCARLRRNTEA